jgi:uncharacterized caspase-like protein
MFRQVLCAAFVLSALFTGPTAARAENRVALVIGESAYRAVTPLPNPANDARAMSRFLGDAGFEVTTAENLTREEMNAAVGEFASHIAARGPDTVALVFYAGHGLQIDGENYLVPVDVDPQREADIPLQAVRLDDILNTLNSAPTKMRILLLDACRNNPFPAINRTAGRGLAMVDAKSGAPGTFMSYSTSPGAEAEDGSGSDSPYTTALLSAAREPGVPIEEAFKRVRLAVNKATDGRQTPWDSSSLTDDFRFMPASGPSSANAAPHPTPVKQTVDQWRQQIQGRSVDAARDMVVADGSLEAYQAFVATYAQSQYTPQMRLWIDRQTRMIAWNEAVTINTAASYRAFLAQYPDSDLAATARKLVVRLQYKPTVAPVVAALAAPSSAAGNCNAPTAAPIKKAETAPTNAAPTNVEPPVVVRTAVVAPIATPVREPLAPVRVMTPSRPIEEPVGVYPRRPIYSGPVGVRYAGFGGGYGGLRGGGFRGPFGFGGRGFRRF